MEWIKEIDECAQYANRFLAWVYGIAVIGGIGVIIAAVVHTYA